MKFYDITSTKSYTIFLPVPNFFIDKKDVKLFLQNEEGKGGQFSAAEVINVIWLALDKYFKENH